MVLTDEYKQVNFPLVTFEDENLANENLFFDFDNVDKDRTNAVPAALSNTMPGGTKVQLFRKTSSAAASQQEPASCCG